MSELWTAMVLLATGQGYGLGLAMVMAQAMVSPSLLALPVEKDDLGSVCTQGLFCKKTCI